MAKTMTIREKRERMEKELARLTAFEDIITTLEDNLVKWRYCTLKYDENGKAICDGNGDYVYIEPEADDSYYNEFMAMKSAIEEIKALV